MIEVDSTGRIVSYTGPAGVNIMRMRTILSGLRLEMTGMRLTRKAPSCFSIARKEYGLKGNKEKILAAFTALLAKAEAAVPVVVRK